MKSTTTNSSDEQLRKENQQLVDRLTNEFGMQGYGSSLSPKDENAWLKSVLAYEKAQQEKKKK